jgi:hypothetical protein
MTIEIPAQEQTTPTGVVEAITGWFLCDISRARRALGTHYNVGDGSCWHQGATRERFMWPCEILLCARRALILHAQKERQREQRR